MHAFKMVAALQGVSKRVVLLRVETAGGHGVGKRIEELTDAYSFLWRELGVK
jgi:prolyl oligopeptidase PreP (S9A serine peptidase family)